MLKAQDILIVTHDEEAYPALLRTIPDPPRQFHVLGKLPPAHLSCVAIVGTRKATEAGKALARRAGEELSRRGVVVVSGLALGIDAAAHEGALRGGTPTIAVLGGDVYSYPRSNDALAVKILEDGAIIAEEPVGVSIKPFHFLRRNRIVSGLSAATIIIEAPERSGALATARFAAEQGRDILVFPGFYSHPNYRGSHALIRDGARLVSSIRDILEDLNISMQIDADYSAQISADKEMGSNESAVFEIIRQGGAALSIDNIVQLTKLESRIVAGVLTTLLIKNYIKETERGYTI